MSLLEELKIKTMVSLGSWRWRDSGFSSDPQRRPFDMSFKATAANDGYSFKVHSNLQATDG